MDLLRVAETQDELWCAELHLQVCPYFACLSCFGRLLDGHVGHSLGAGVASLAAPWAALQWPGADIRCVTFGNPKPGNQAYSDVSCHLPSPLLPWVCCPHHVSSLLLIRFTYLLDHLPACTLNVSHSAAHSRCLP